MAEAEVARLRLRIDGRPTPYYTVLKEFFATRQEKFVPPDHICTCNICCLDLQSIKEAAVKEALITNLDHKVAERKPVDVKVVDDEVFNKIKQEYAETQALLQAKDRTIDYLTQRLEKVRSGTQSLITEDTINKSASVKCLMV